MWKEQDFLMFLTALSVAVVGALTIYNAQDGSRLYDDTSFRNLNIFFGENLL